MYPTKWHVRMFVALLVITGPVYAAPAVARKGIQAVKHPVRAARAAATLAGDAVELARCLAHEPER